MIDFGTFLLICVSYFIVLVFFGLLYYYPKYQKDKLQESFKEIKKEPVTQKDLEKLMNGYLDSKSLLWKINERLYWSLIALFSLLLTLFILLFTELTLNIGLVLLVIFTFMLLVVEKVKIRYLDKKILTLIFLHYMIIFTSYIFAALILVSLFSLPDVVFGFGIFEKNLFLSFAGISFSFALSLLVVTSVSPLLKVQRRLSKKIMDELVETLSSDETNDIDEYFSKNAEVLDRNMRPFNEIRRVYGDLRTLTFFQLVYMILGVVFIFSEIYVQKHFGNLENLPPHNFNVEILFISFLVVIIIMTGMTFWSLVSNTLLKYFYVDEEELDK